MKFEETPNYDFLINLFKKVIIENCSTSDPDYDWNNSLRSQTHYEIQKYNSNVNKNKNKSMFLNNKSTNAFDNKDDTGISPKINNELNKMSIFQDDK